jgi:hypothetical protein
LGRRNQRQASFALRRLFRYALGRNYCSQGSTIVPEYADLQSRAPKQPTHIPGYAEECLRALADQGMGACVSIGGALGLLHYLDYRATRDVDAWWVDDVTAEDRRAVIGILTEVLSEHGEVRPRQWGDVTSIELVQGGRATFSFQIAHRSARLESPSPAPWVAVLLDRPADLIASKMAALVERGAPRDFVDIYTVCLDGLASPQDCWALWQRRQELAGSDSDLSRARLAIQTHLARIIQHRPLETIVDPRERADAERLRAWFTEVLPHAQPH